MNLESLRDLCLQLPGVEESFPFGEDTLVFKVKNKIFLLTGLDGDGLSFNVKCDPEKAVELREQYPYVLPGYHMNKKHWNTVKVTGAAPDHLLRSWITGSYHLVVQSLPKKNREELQWK